MKPGFKSHYDRFPVFLDAVMHNEIMSSYQVIVNFLVIKAEARSKLEQAMVDECVEWAKQQGLKNVTKLNVDAFLHEKESVLPNYILIRQNYAIVRDTIYRTVNMRLKSPWTDSQTDLKTS